MPSSSRRKLRAVDYRDWPKPTPTRDNGLVAFIEGDFDEIAASLSAKPKTFAHRATKLMPRFTSRTIFLVLSNGAPAALTEDSLQPGKIELSLRVERDTFAFDDDFAEVIEALGVSPDKVRKFEGNFTWLPNRKAKRVEPKEEPLPEDWWNQGRVLSDNSAEVRRLTERLIDRPTPRRRPRR